ncbi:MAG: tryptophan--tRNA ligase, partial [Bradyrhizobium sp.]|nr:tryptophan--tRNA ligase [Bradyrhizobium sp.]
AFKATIVPVGDDQVPLIEQTNEIVRRINRQTGKGVLKEARALISTVGRLPGVDGKAKMSKSQGNTIPLSATADQIRDAVRRMFTDPQHVRAADPGRIEGNVVFTYLDAFDADRDAVADLKARYVRGGLGDSAVKKRLEDVLQDVIAPIRARRTALAREPDHVLAAVRRGTERAQSVTAATLRELRAALGLLSLH